MANPQQQPAPTPEQLEADFRSTLEDVVEVLTRLAPKCGSVEDMIGMCQLATKNEGQLRLLMQIVLPVRLMTR